MAIRNDRVLRKRGESKLKANEVSLPQFASWLFERDKNARLYDEGDTYLNIEQEERDGYIEEAMFCMTLPSEDWPEEVLAHLDKQ
jgi:hypothetical protein